MVLIKKEVSREYREQVEKMIDKSNGGVYKFASSTDTEEMDVFSIHPNEDFVISIKKIIVSKTVTFFSAKTFFNIPRIHYNL